MNDSFSSAVTATTRTMSRSPTNFLDDEDSSIAYASHVLASSSFGTSLRLSSFSSQSVSQPPPSQQQKQQHRAPRAGPAAPRAYSFAAATTSYGLPPAMSSTSTSSPKRVRASSASANASSSVTATPIPPLSPVSTLSPASTPSPLRRAESAYVGAVSARHASFHNDFDSDTLHAQSSAHDREDTHSHSHRQSLSGAAATSLSVSRARARAASRAVSFTADPSSDAFYAYPYNMASNGTAIPNSRISSTLQRLPPPDFLEPLPQDAFLSAALPSDSETGVPTDRLEGSITSYDATIPRLMVRDASGAKHSLSELVRSAPVSAVLIFVPRAVVEIAALVYGKVAHLLQAAGARLVFVTAWTPRQAATFLSRFERLAPFPGMLVCDETGDLFARFNFTRSKLGAFMARRRFARGGPLRHGVRNALSNVTYRAQNRDLSAGAVSASRLRCGAVVVSSGGGAVGAGVVPLPSVAYCREADESTGVACYLDVMDACGVQEAFVPEIDVAHLYTRFNNMRSTHSKARNADAKEERARAQSVKHAPPPPAHGGPRYPRRHTWLGT